MPLFEVHYCILGLGGMGGDRCPYLEFAKVV